MYKSFDLKLHYFSPFQQYMGRILRVNFSDNPKPKEPLYPETEYKLFVGNLSWSATSESLTQAFQEYGNVVGARVLYDGETGKSRGYGFVCYSTKAEMQTALVSLDGVVQSISLYSLNTFSVTTTIFFFFGKQLINGSCVPYLGTRGTSIARKLS
jgi:RNA recognition motif-containing protein